jgi:hypothetical protein
MAALIGAATDAIFDDPVLDEFTTTLEKNSSALVLVGEKPTLADFDGVISTWSARCPLPRTHSAIQTTEGVLHRR